MKGDAARRNARRLDAVVTAHGGNFTRGRQAFFREAQLSRGQGDQAYPVWRREAGGPDGTRVGVPRGPKKGHYRITKDMGLIRRTTLHEDRLAYGKLLNAWSAARSTLERMDPHTDLDGFVELSVEQGRRKESIIILGRLISKQAEDAGTPTREIEGWFARVPSELRP